MKSEIVAFQHATDDASLDVIHRECVKGTISESIRKLNQSDIMRLDNYCTVFIVFH